MFVFFYLLVCFREKKSDRFNLIYPFVLDPHELVASIPTGKLSDQRPTGACARCRCHFAAPPRGADGRDAPAPHLAGSLPPGCVSWDPPKKAGKIWEDMTTYGKIWDNMGKYGITMMNQWVKGYPTFRQTMTNHDKPWQTIQAHVSWIKLEMFMPKFEGFNGKVWGN
jgi:hypothetical protein